ncbi:MAG: thiol:disulfide interchange protein DsbA/DsbL [Gammaproteobacteria bacterium]
MKKSVLVSILLTFSLTACGADSASNTAANAATDAKQMASAAAETVMASTTKISPSSIEALEKMGPEAGRANFDAAAVVAQFKDEFVAGKDYQVLAPAQPTSSDPENIEVAEVFMYSCPHCYNFEPFIKTWLNDSKPVGVNFLRIPAQFNRPAQLHAAAYYAAEALGVGEQVHLPLFKAIHGNRNPLNSEGAIKKIFTENGVDGNDFDKAFSSFDVDTKTRQAANLNKRYKIQSVPTLIINGRYQTSGIMAKSNERLKNIVNYLVAKEMTER